MTACCYAARGKEASDNADRGPQRRRSRAQLKCHSSSLFEGGGREREREREKERERERERERESGGGE